MRAVISAARRRLGGRLRVLDRWVVAAWAAVVLPIVVATGRAVAGGWLPIGDNALFSVRALDVGTRHHPWLGTWSSASIGAGHDVNHPGPILFDALALPVRLFGTHAGVAVGAATVNVVAVTLVAVLGWRVAGRAGALTCLLPTAWLAFTMGSELLFDPWNPHILLLPCCALLAAGWATASNVRGGWPWLLAIGSFAVQVHLGYVYIVAGLVAVAVGWRLWVAHRLVPAGGWRPAARSLAGRAPLAVVAALWAQPLWDQVAGEGNLLALARAGGSGDEAIGPTRGLRILGSVWLQTPWTARGRFVDAVPTTFYESPGRLAPYSMTSLWAALAVLALAVAATAAALRVAAGRADLHAQALLVVVGGVQLVAALAVVVMPLGALGLSAHQMRWLWPIAAYLVAAVGFTLVRAAIAARIAGGGAWSATAPRVAAVAICLGLGAGNLPTTVVAAGPAARKDLQPALTTLVNGMDRATELGVVWFDASTVPVLDNTAATVLAELSRQGVEFVVDDASLVRQFGSTRRFVGVADTWMQLAFGRDALVPPEGWVVLSVVTVLTPAERSELESLSPDDPQREALLTRADGGSWAVLVRPFEGDGDGSQ